MKDVNEKVTKDESVFSNMSDDDFTEMQRHTRHIKETEEANKLWGTQDNKKG